MTVQQHLSVSIIGDAFADLFCFLGDSTLPKPGGDARLTQPIRTVAGGSGLNTATHLSSLGRSRSGAGACSGSGAMDVSLHTVLNESDDYGRLLTSHAKQHGFYLVNCRRALDDSNEDDKDNHSSSTGHCTVIVSRGERSFMTHLGCVSAFKADHVDVDGVLLGTRENESNSSYNGHHLHVHIAGFFNIDGFFDGQLKKLLQTIRDRRGSGTTISLVPQHDATEVWDGGLLDLLPLVDYLICSELEAECIVNIAASPNTSTATSGISGSNDILQQLASFFHRASPNTCVVVTLGSKGAVALRDGEIVHRQEAPTSISDPIDPTGAGDAFAAGFLHGIHRFRGESEIGDDDSSILRSGLFHGCLLGTACVMKEGASTPATSGEIEALIQKSSPAGEMSSRPY